MQTKRFLITRPNHDDAVSYLFQWSIEILKFAKNKGINYSDFKGSKANRKEVTKFLIKQDPGFVIFNGHGSRNIINGHKDEPIIICDENEHLLKSKITYAIACDAAAELGQKAVDKGANAFIRYEGPFCFVRDAAKECTPSRDKFVVPFKKFSNEVIISLLKGKTIKEAYERSQKIGLDLIKEYSASDAIPEYKDIRFWLFWDKNFQKFIGEEIASFL